MAQPWKQTLEPYIKVTESVRTSTLPTTAGENLIVGAVIISDSGPSVPTLVTSQSEFLAHYASQDLTEDYVKSLNKLYTSDSNSTLASQMWLNAFRLSGSTNLLVCRASKASDIIYVKSLDSSDSHSYIIKDSEVLRKVDSEARLRLDETAEGVFAIYVEGVGVIGNYINDSGVAYDYYAGNVYELLCRLNETPKFHCTNFICYDENEAEITDFSVENQVNIKSIQILEMYVASDFFGKESNIDEGIHDPASASVLKNLNVESTFISTLEAVGIFDINAYATNLYNTSTGLSVRIRKYNHDAVSVRALSTLEEQSGVSPYSTLSVSLDKLLKDEISAQAAKGSDFYEFAIMDPGISDYPLLFNVGNYPGRGDITYSELNKSLKMMQITLPENLDDLNLEYHNYNGLYVDASKTNEINVDLSIDSSKTSLLNVTDTDIMEAFDKIEDDERYVVEGLTDLGCTYTNIQNYIANIAINSNYFYPVSTADSLNYMTIASKSTKITGMDNKIYMLSPWDYDDGTVGFMFHASPSVLYWETVSRNRRNNSEFRGAFGPEGGVCSLVNLSKEFSKTERQLLLTKKVNTIFHDLYLDSLYINDNKTRETEENVLAEENNTRLQIRISKAMPLILKQFIGRQNNVKTALEAESVINSWFRSSIVPMRYKCSDWKVQVADITDFSTNTMRVKVQVKFFNSIKFIDVYNEALPLDLEFE